MHLCRPARPGCQGDRRGPLAVDANPGGSGELFETNIHYSAKEADLLSEYLHGKVLADRSYSAFP
jgi:hypothetical protein